jgi:glycerol-3-phosphate dehydrogenase
MLFVSPWRDYSIIGTFHSHYQGNPDQFKVKEEHLQNILVEVNSAYPGADLEGEDVTFIHYGFLAEKKDSSRREVKLVRQGQVFDHRTEDSIEGLITVVGVKYTTARHIAEKAVDLVFNHLEKKPPNCKTDFTPLHDGQIESFDDLLSRAKKEDACKLNPMVIDHLVRNYGSNYGQVRGSIENGEANVPLELGSPQVLRAQVFHAVHEEMALKLSDVILRRTGLGSAGKPETPNLLRCADFMADELDWDDNKKAKEIDEVEANYNSLGLGGRN